MFWTIVGALAFFFIGLPLICGMLMQKWFWWLMGVGLLLIGSMMLSEWQKDSSRRAYYDRQEELERKKQSDTEVSTKKEPIGHSSTAHYTVKPVNNYTAPVDPFRNNSAATEAQVSNAVNDSEWNRNWGRSWEQQKREKKILSLIQEGKDEIERLLAIAGNGRGALDSYLKALSSSELIRLQEYIFAEEQFYQGNVPLHMTTEKLDLIKAARRRVDFYASTR